MRLKASLIVLAGWLLANTSFAGMEIHPLRRAHAHNDYLHARPLEDALAAGFCSVEADVHLVDGKLLVGHSRKECKLGRSLEVLYLYPLQKRVREGKGVYPGVVDFSLWIDIKSERGNEHSASETTKAVVDLLQNYSDMLSTFSAQGIRTNFVTVILTGDHRREQFTNREALYCYDSHLSKLSADSTNTFSPVVTENWTSVFQSHGEGTMPEGEVRTLQRLVDAVHRRGQRIRFWAVPDKHAVWKQLIDANVDWIGTDQLNELARFLHKEEKAAFTTK